MKLDTKPIFEMGCNPLLSKIISEPMLRINFVTLFETFGSFQMRLQLFRHAPIDRFPLFEKEEPGALLSKIISKRNAPH